MNKRPFYINQRFFIDPSMNLLKDKVEQKEFRVEPRILDVLYMLTERSGETITREEMVTRIWEDYGGGDEGLTQAISTLRKLLADSGKELIQTVPKKGYCFKGEVIFEQQERVMQPKHLLLRSSKKILSLSIIGAVLFIVVLLVLDPFSSNEKNLPDTSSQPAEVSFPGMQPEIESVDQNESNTIVTRGPDSTIYKLIMIGDEAPQFFINDQRIPVHQWEPYQDLINNLKSQLQKKNAGLNQNP